MDIFREMGDVQIAFGILTHCFVQHPSYLLQCTPLSFTFTKSSISFYSSFLQVFGHLLGSRSFDILEKLLVHKQTYVLITFGIIKFILTVVITPISYLRNWAFVILVMTIRFMVDQHPFLFEALARIDNNTFPFQQYLKVACDILPPLARACFFPFEQLIRQ